MVGEVGFWLQPHTAGPLPNQIWVKPALFLLSPFQLGWLQTLLTSLP